MAQNLGVYNIQEVNPIIKGIDLSEGLAENEPMYTERMDPKEFTAKVGAKGDFTFQKNNNKAGTFILTYKQNADKANQFLRSLLESSAIFPVQFVARHSYKELASGTYCMIEEAPRKRFAAKEESDRVWRIITGELIETDKAL